MDLVVTLSSLQVRLTRSFLFLFFYEAQNLMAVDGSSSGMLEMMHLYWFSESQRIG
jgi:hypothetical protein